MTTPNHKYSIPAEGTTDWHIPLNQNFTDLDTDVEIRDIEQNKSDYKPKEGAKYEATDSGAIYYGSGDTWVLAKRQVSELTTDERSDSGNIVLSYKDSNGYTKHESYQSLTVAADRINETRRNTGLLTIAGDVEIDEPLVYQDDWLSVTIRGIGNRTSRIIASDDFSGQELVDFSGNNIINFWGSIEDIQFHGKSNVPVGIRMHGAQNGLLRNIHIAGTTSYGITLDNSAFDNVFFRCRTREDTGGVYIGNANECTFYSCMFRSSGHNVELGDGANLVGPRFYNCKFRSIGSEYRGLWWKNNARNHNVIIQGCHFEGDGVGISYAPSNGGSFASGWISGCKFNQVSTAIKTRSKVGEMLIGPKNMIDTNSQVDLGHNSFSREVIMFFNRGIDEESLQYNSDRTTVFEPFADIIDFNSSYLTEGYAVAPTDLSNTEATYDGEMRIDDGTNTPHRGTTCVWDKSGSVWVRPDGTTFT